jgi:hypothetical protein
MAPYAENAIFETPAILVTLTDRREGILRGKSELRPFFEAGFRKLGNELSRWYRTDLFFSNGRQLTWEYPRETPKGNQVDLVEVIDIDDGLISHHRVYWGWVGFQTLVAALINLVELSSRSIGSIPLPCCGTGRNPNSPLFRANRPW